MDYEDIDYDSDGRLIRCVYAVMRIEGYTDCEDNSTTELVAISSHGTKKEAREVARKGEGLIVVKVPLPTGTKLEKANDEDDLVNPHFLGKSAQKH